MKQDTKQRLIYFAPLFVFVSLALLFWFGVHNDPRIIPTVMLEKKIPTFDLPTLQSPKQRFTDKRFLGKVSLLNVWATWCSACRIEHPMLMDIANSKLVVLYGMDYKDNVAAAQTYLQQFGDPYQANAFDYAGQVAIDWGVYGTPETFLVDKKGFIRYKHIGIITKSVWTNQLLPLIRTLQAEQAA